MPYIESVDREQYEPFIRALSDHLHAGKPGDLNYVITRLILWWLADRGVSYERLNAVMGVLESVKQEFYRRQVVPYEERKIKENGDV
jgi:hypothetical protein